MEEWRVTQELFVLVLSQPTNGFEAREKCRGYNRVHVSDKGQSRHHHSPSQTR